MKFADFSRTWIFFIFQNFFRDRGNQAAQAGLEFNLPLQVVFTGSLFPEEQDWNNDSLLPILPVFQNTPISKSHVLAWQEYAFK